MKIRDNLALFSVAAVAVTLEGHIIATWWSGRSGYLVQVTEDKYILMSHAYLALICLAVYWMGCRILRPLAGVIEGITLFGAGKLSHRIPPARVRELDELSTHLNTMAARLGELDGLKNDFIANVSHELRSPLAAIESYLALLEDDAALPKRGRENVRRIGGNITRLRHMVEELLDSSQIESRRITLHPESFRLEDAAAEVYDLYESKAKSAGIEFRLGASGDVPRARGDTARTHQILVNLVDNALKFTRSGGTITLTVSEADGRPGVSVSDTGVGIASEDRDHIFERFRRPASRRGKSGVRGTGLGLSISRELARAMGGELVVSSIPGQGSIFMLTLPREEG